MPLPRVEGENATVHFDEDEYVKGGRQPTNYATAQVKALKLFGDWISNFKMIPIFIFIFFGSVKCIIILI